MAIKITPVDLAAAQARRIQAQTAVNEDVRNSNNAAYQKALTASKSGKPQELDILKSQKADLERYVKNLSSLDFSKTDQRKQTGINSNPFNSGWGADVERFSRYGSYEQSKAGFDKAKSDLASVSAKVDELTKLLAPEYITDVPTAPAYDPGSKKSKISTARAMRQRGGRAATILSQGN